MHKVFCDKCGKEIGTSVDKGYISPGYQVAPEDCKVSFEGHVPGSISYTNYRIFNLCNSCYIEALELFDKWIREKYREE
jgi:hypothetical protein